MTETLLALVPTYGLWLLVIVIGLGCLGVPLPASMLVMASGGFAASEDLVLWQVFLVTFGSYALGDQIAFMLARTKGEPWLERFRAKPRTGKIIRKAETRFQQWGGFAVFLSRTILSPLGPYIAYISGASGFSWRRFTAFALVGAACWSAFYAFMGYTFANNIEALSLIISNGLGFIMACIALISLCLWLRRAWKKYKALEAAEILATTP